jgi:hypothetical protein
MIDRSVPTRSSSWSGTGTVVVVPSARFCMTTWLPRRRTSTNPCCARMAQASRPERTRSLATRYVQPRDVHFGVQTPLHLGGIRGFEEQLHRFAEVGARLLHVPTLAGDVELGTQCNIPVPLAFDDRRELCGACHPQYVLTPNFALKPGTRSTVDEARKRFEGDDPLAQMEAQLRLRRTHEAIKRVVLRESVNQPLLVLIEDLHWIDSETQALLNLLADSIGTAKMLLLVNYRPEYTHGWGSKTCYRQVRLDPLGRESAEEMLAALLGPSSPVPDKRVDSLQRAPFETRPAEGRSSDTMSGRSP